MLGTIKRRSVNEKYEYYYKKDHDKPMTKEDKQNAWDDKEEVRKRKI